MRWFVEISSSGQNAQPSRKVCVEAAQWQPALQKARALRGDHGPLNNFSVDLLETGYRAIDPATRVRYVVQRAPDDAALTDEPGASPAAAAASPGVAEPEARPAARRAPAPTVPFISMGAALVVTEPAAGAAQPAAGAAQPAAGAAQPAAGAAQPAAGAAQPAAGAAQPADGAAKPADGAAKRADGAAQPAVGVAQPVDGAAPAPAPSALPAFELVSQRAEDPSERSPLTYRELVYAVATGTPRELVNALLLDRIEVARKLIDDARPGKFIHIAVFDHVFHGRPQRGPLATLAWKDWRSGEPEIQFRPRTSGTTPPPPAATPAAAATPLPAAAPPAAAATPLPAAATPAAAVTPLPAAAPFEELGSPARLDAAATAAAAAPPAPSRPPRRRSSYPPGNGRLSGDDLLAELFEACSDLHFLQDTLAGADFILALTVEKIPCTLGLVSLFDINRREFVVVRQHGGKGALLTRLSERAPLALAAMRSRRAVVVPDAASDERVMDDRWKAAGVELRSVVCAPVELAGRYLGLLEIANPLDGKPFSESDGNALTYIGQQFAEFVGARGVVTEPGLVTAGTKRAAR
ncbi:GAF domain-containing protein [Sorangium sp. So ce854]|uniref:GAF domain-containing protein n=1 Tax=Sorangium sp. So ce854 TaxID=3133322 RepID=UPI003F62C3D4